MAPYRRETRSRGQIPQRIQEVSRGRQEPEEQREAQAEESEDGQERVALSAMTTPTFIQSAPPRGGTL